MQRQISRHTCSETLSSPCLGIVLRPGLSHFFVSQKFLLAPKMPFIPRAKRRSITAVKLCCFSKPNISLAVTFKHYNYKFASYIAGGLSLMVCIASRRLTQHLLMPYRDHGKRFLKRLGSRSQPPSTARAGTAERNLAKAERNPAKSVWRTPRLFCVDTRLAGFRALNAAAHCSHLVAVAVAAV